MDSLPTEETLFDLAAPYLDTRGNWIHTRISWAYARRLLEAEGGDPEVVLPAVILHDIGWKLVPEELQMTCFGPFAKDASLNRVHEVEGARIARSILVQVGYDSALIGEIADIILNHDSRLTPVSVSDMIVKDADKLFRYSAEGFALDTRRFGLDPARSIGALRRKIADWLITDTARRIAHEALDSLAVE